MWRRRDRGERITNQPDLVKVEEAREDKRHSKVLQKELKAYVLDGIGNKKRYNSRCATLFLVLYVCVFFKCMILSP